MVQQVRVCDYVPRAAGLDTITTQPTIMQPISAMVQLPSSQSQQTRTQEGEITDQANRVLCRDRDQFCGSASPLDDLHDDTSAFPLTPNPKFAYISTKRSRAQEVVHQEGQSARARAAAARRRKESPMIDAATLHPRNQDHADRSFHCRLN